MPDIEYVDKELSVALFDRAKTQTLQSRVQPDPLDEIIR
jgi:hypothetical protein